jgi:hypothetical protein|nr:hypothetical protein [Kofleriaceae bacterium]
MAPRASAALAFALPLAGACTSAGVAMPTVPHTTGPITVEGEWTEPDWARLALRRQFAGDDGLLARPSSDVRVMADDSTVYVGLYAADDDLESATDAFVLAIGELAMRVDVRGRATPAMPDVQIGVDHDGSLDDTRNYDEEWVLEIAIPRARVGSGAQLVAATRCDTPLHSTQRCGGWAGMVQLSASPTR